MKILITGATGFLGKHVQREFARQLARQKAKEADVSLLSPGSESLDLTDRASTVNYVAAQRPERILHLAAVCGGILANKRRPADFLHLNSLMALNLFEAACRSGVEHFYSVGSVCAYPKFCPVPFQEDTLWDGYPEETNAPYGTAKRLTLVMQQSCRDQYGLKGAHVIPVNMYGEHDHFDPENSHVIPALIRRFINAAQVGAPRVECWGTGEATREFLYAGDCARALVGATLGGFDSDLPINLGTGESISIKALANLIAELCGFSGEIVFNGEVSDGQPRRQLDVSRAERLLGFRAETDLRAGLIRTIQWYRESEPSIPT